jgi:hypothetical protein
MMKNEINLLPPKALKKRRQYLLLKRTGSLLRRVIILEIVLVFLVSIGIVANMKLEEIVMQKQEDLNMSQLEVKEKAKKINVFLNEIESWRNRYETWSPVIHGMLEVMPTGVKIDSVQASWDGQVIFQGGFEDPSQIVTFRRELENLEGVKEVEAPLSNYSTGSDLKFKLVVIR